MNKYVIVVNYFWARKKHGKNYGRKFIYNSNYLTETVECAMVGKRVTMLRLMKSKAAIHRAADRKFVGEKGDLNLLMNYKLSLRKYEDEYKKECIKNAMTD